MKQSFKKRNTIIAGVTVLGIGLFSMVQYQNAVTAVPYAVATEKELVKIVEATGTIVSNHTMGVYNKEVGFLNSVSVAVGDTVAAGQVMAIMSSEDLSLQYATALSRVAASEAALKKASEKEDANAVRIAQDQVKVAEASWQDAQTTYARTKALWDKGTVSQADLETAKLALDKASSALSTAKAQLNMTLKGASKNTLNELRANVNAARAEVKRLEQASGNMKIMAPMSGVVTEKLAEEGAYLTQGTKLLSLSDLKTLRVDSDVLDKDLSQIRLGESVKLYVDEKLVGEGEVTKIHPTVFDKTSELGIVQKRVRVEVAIRQMKQPLLMGQDLDLKYEVTKKPNSLCVDKDFVYESGSQHYVLIISKGRLAKAYVTLGLEGENDYEILIGLKANERIVGEMEKPLDVGARVKWSK